ncbi:MAG: universal stress protein [Pirellulaceae bacterium]|nr:universal stress protein [Pirellulaceae bacterium]
MKVIFATDGSSSAKAAARLLRQFKVDGKLNLVLLTVSMNPELTVHGNIQNPDWEGQQRNFVRDLHDELNDYFASQSVELSKLHKTGNAAQEILSVSKSNVADLIVMGAMGHSMLSRLLLGSVSDTVATNAKCSVLVVRPKNDVAPTTGFPKKIIVAYDGSAASQAAVHELLTVKWAEGSEVSIVMVAPTNDYLMGDGLNAGLIANDAKALKSLRAKGEKVSKQLSARIPNTQVRVIQGSHVGDTITSFAEQNKSELIILGDTGHSQLDELFLGSTTKYVLRYAPCSVWISRYHRAAAEV